MVSVIMGMTGRRVLGACWNNVRHCILLIILVLPVSAQAKAGETTGSSKALPNRTLSEIEASHENGTLTVVIKMDRPLEPTVLTVENPPRLVLDFPGTVNRIPFKKLALNTASVKRVRVSQFQSADPGIARVVFDLGEGFGSHRISLGKSSVQVTFLPRKTFADKTISASKVKSDSTGSTTVKPTGEGNNILPVWTDALPPGKRLPIRTLSEIEAFHEKGVLTVTIKMDRPLLVPTVFTVENPLRLVLDFPDTVNRVPFKKLPLDTATVKRVRVSQFRRADPRIARVVFDLGEGFGSHRISLDKSSVQVTFFPGKTVARETVSASEVKSDSTESATVESVPRQKNGFQTESSVPIEIKDSEQAVSRSPEKVVSSIGRPQIAGPSVPPEKPEPYSAKEDSPMSSSFGKSESALVKSAAEGHNASSIRSDALQGELKTPITADRNPAQTEAFNPQSTPPVSSAVASRISMDPAPLSLGQTLDQIGKSVEQFRTQFESVACTEFVSQTKLGKGNSVIYKKDQEFDYMIFTEVGKDGMRVEESRQEKRKKGKTKDLPLLVTEGFPTLLLIFHPYYQGSFKYKFIGEEMVEGQNLIRIDFKHVRGRRSTSILHLQSKNYPLELEGTAWIDPESYNIRRIKAGLIKPMEAVGLQTFNSDVLYMPMQFASNEPTYWMPETATVEVMTPKQHWRNVHRFEDYKRFSVSSTSEIAVP